MRAQIRSMMRIITLDPGWLGGDYQVNPLGGVVTALTSQNSWWFTPRWYESNIGTREQQSAFERAQRDFWAVQLPQDARDLYYQMRHWGDYDIGETPGFAGDTHAALASIKAGMLLVSFPRDRMVLPQEITLVREAVPHAVALEIDSDYGHVACCGFDPEAPRRMGEEITTAALAGAPAPRPDAGGAHTPEHQMPNLGAFTFESGEVVEDFKVSYVTHGRLNEARDNVILAMQHFIGDHHDNDFLIGPGKALDTDKYFIVAPDFISNARLRQDVTTGPTNSGLNMNFPEFTILDSVAVEVRFLTEYLGIDHIRAATGGSIGAMKAFQLAVSYPDFVSGVIPIAGTPRVNPQMRSQLRNMMRIITLDPGWLGGRYQTNPLAGVLTALTGFSNSWLYSPQWYDRNLGTPEQYREFEHFWRDVWALQIPQDARDLYYQTRHWADFDIGNTPGFDGDTQAALASITAEMLLIASASDIMMRPEETAPVREAVPHAVYLELDSDYGHVACCGWDPEATQQMEPVIAKFLADLE
jgi:homoserine O-acetyltransferase